jgi:hypothetical protein
VTPFEPYVADPTERRPAPRFVRLRPLLATLAVLVVALSVVYLLFGAQAAQDPSLEAPVEQRDAAAR